MGAALTRMPPRPKPRDARPRPAVTPELGDPSATLFRALAARSRDVIFRFRLHPRLAFDDAGAGVVNFRHLVELRPDFVKIDAALVKNVNADLTRQALVVGLCHFAEAIRNAVIAEGVESEAELATLRGLDVSYGQGYLPGPPLPVDEVLPRRAALGVSTRPGTQKPELPTP